MQTDSRKLLLLWNTCCTSHELESQRRYMVQIYKLNSTQKCNIVFLQGLQRVCLCSNWLQNFPPNGSMTTWTMTLSVTALQLHFLHQSFVDADSRNLRSCIVALMEWNLGLECFTLHGRRNRTPVSADITSLCFTKLYKACHLYVF